MATKKTNKLSIKDEYIQKMTELLKKQSVYSEMDADMIELLGILKQDALNSTLSKREQRETIKLFFQLSKDFGGTPASRQTLKIKTDTEPEEDAEKDLRDFVRD